MHLRRVIRTWFKNSRHHRWHLPGQGCVAAATGGAGYFWSSYQWCEGDGFSLTKYCFDAYYGNDGFSDGQHALLPEDDAAQKEFGDTWRIPTDGEMRELVSKCTWEWTELNGVNGYEVTGPSGKSIFLPAVALSRFGL